ncbi:hypothetical protein [Mycobacterium paragordonae]|uniref:Uncharacterized protein n=1 Tax=Mycobacterium paragordonae TaxID=1389713 RepID=A0AAJ1S8M7_9MYCO|nr:hypothetical protein [Mycobacterium paragordonae]MDP7737457.1 hypothetical protein [Mycobacterium paragordonae]GFG76766.1 hypothetical protein MPRG_00420 [Mycobacterium paragordonae]
MVLPHSAPSGAAMSDAETFLRFTSARELAFPLLAVVGIVGYADVRIPMGLPGHRGLIWLTLLVAVCLTSRRRSAVLAVGATATIATMFAASPAGAGSVRYVAAAALLYTICAVPMARRHRWVVALAAAPVHLVSLANSMPALIGTESWGEKVLFHLGFGLAAGVLAWVIAAVVRGVDKGKCS